MIHLKLYGLPRTYTNWVAFNLMSTWPEHVKVWHNNCPSDPTGENYWKHGPIIEVPNVDGYILISKDWEAWCASMLRYLQLGVLNIDERFLPFIYRGWREEAKNFYDLRLLSGQNAVFKMWPPMSTPTEIRVSMWELYNEIRKAFNLPETDVCYETKRMWRAGDMSTLEQYLTEEEYESPKD